MVRELDNFRPVPFYFITTSDPADFTDAAVNDAMQKVKDAGFGGIIFFNKPPHGFNETEYLSDFWFEVTEKFIIAARKLGLQFWINDGFNYPPGDAAGRIEKAAPYLKQYRLRPNPEGKCIPEATAWGFPAFEEEESSELFHRFVYEQYYKKLGKYFGNGITGFFSDADNRRINAMTQKPLNGETFYPWCRSFPEKFSRRFGYDIVPELKGLFDRSNKQVCHDYWLLCGELYQQWFANNHMWCKKHGVKYTFHTSDTGPITLEMSPRASAFSEGDPLTLLKHSDFPGTDHEIEVLDSGTHYDRRLFTPQVSLGKAPEKLAHPAFSDTFWDLRAKLAGSAAFLNGADGAMCEMFAATNWGTNYNNLSRIAAWQIMQGITFIVPHAVHYKFHGETKFFAPPEFLTGTMAAGIREFNDRLARYCQAAAGGKYLADIAVVEPSRKLWEGADSRNFFTICDKLNRKAAGFVIASAEDAGKFPVVIDPLTGKDLPEIAECASFTGGELIYMPREINGEKYLLAGNIWSDAALSGTLSFNGKNYDVEIAPGEIAIFGGAFESYRKAEKRETIREFSGTYPVKFAGNQLIPFEKVMDLTVTEKMAVTLYIPEKCDSALLDGKMLAGKKSAAIAGDRYSEFALSLLPGNHQLRLTVPACFETPAYLAGDIAVEIRTENDYSKQLAYTYQLQIFAPEKLHFTLHPRRKELSTRCGWEQQGQSFYSGMVEYELGEISIDDGDYLEMPEFSGIAEVLADGNPVGKCAFAPYRFALPAGKHAISLRCWNSMGNLFERYAAISGITAPPVITRKK